MLLKNVLIVSRKRGEKFEYFYQSATTIEEPGVPSDCPYISSILARLDGSTSIYVCIMIVNIYRQIATMLRTLKYRRYRWWSEGVFLLILTRKFNLLEIRTCIYDSACIKLAPVRSNFIDNCLSTYFCRQLYIARETETRSEKAILTRRIFLQQPRPSWSRRFEGVSVPVLGEMN